MEEMQQLRDKANVERIKAKQDQKVVEMEKERDWFREEALRLNKIQKDQKSILDRLKQQIESAQAERDYCHSQLLEEKMNSKALEVENLKFR